MTTLAELLAPRNRTTIEAILMAALQEAPIEGMPGVRFPVTDWVPGSLERTTLRMIATGVADREYLIRLLTASGFLDLASTLVDPDGKPVEGWMEMLAAQVYRLERAPARYTRQLLTLTCTEGPGPYTRAAGELVAYSATTGNRYVNVAPVEIPDGGSVLAVFQAEEPGVQAPDSPETITGLVTPLPGVSVTNAPTAAGLPASYLTGSGSIEVASTAITSSPRTVQLVFTTTGRIDDHTAWFTCTVYEGNNVTTTGPHMADPTFRQGDLDLALTDGAADSQSFKAGDEWIVAVPGSPMLQAGADAEALPALAQRCRDRWPSLSRAPTAGSIMGMVRQASIDLQIGITKVTTAASLRVAGAADVWIAGTTATATVTQIAAVQAYLEARQVPSCVMAATAVPIRLGGEVTCRRGTIPAVKAAADLAWAQHIAGLDIGGPAPEHLLTLLDFANIIHDAGAYNARKLAFNGAESDVVLKAREVATIADSPDGLPSQALTWREA